MRDKNHIERRRAKNVLVVARWPLGGIRTYMKYVYKYLPDSYKLTILASPTTEDDALRRDAEELGVRLVITRTDRRKEFLLKSVFLELVSNKYDLVQSHGFISATYVYLANYFFRVPHILTVHGIIEKRLLGGITGRLKTALTEFVIKHVDVLYAVSNDILGHLHESIPSLASARCKKVVISNGVDVDGFLADGSSRGSLRKQLNIASNVFLIGFLGRFMQQKGFNYLIDAIDILERDSSIHHCIRVLAVGSGDYLSYYQKVVNERNLEDAFVFVPFQNEVSEIYADLDIVVMPSTWEACPLQPMEAMCVGTPVIASDCIGLRETVRDTPAIVFESKKPRALAAAIRRVINARDTYEETFDHFRSIARRRYDVRKTAERVQLLFENVLEG